ncbi:MAG: hypothetical protein ACLGIR_13640 [Actinomycetes bacterium]
MRRIPTALAAVVALVGSTAALPATADLGALAAGGAGAGQQTVCLPDDVAATAGAPLTSDNVEYVCTIPLEAPGNAGNVTTVDGRTRLYVSSRTGIGIYDVTDPTAITLEGRLPFQHWQNEDTSVSTDGTRLVVAADGGPPFPDQVSRGLFVFDVSDPADITLVGVHPDAPHTASCADDGCTVLYASNGSIYDASGATAPIALQDGIVAARTGQARGIVKKGTFTAKLGGGTVASLHAVQRDASGLITTDSNPRLILDPREDPLAPTIVAQFSPDPRDPRLQHGNLRPDADAYTPRDPQAPVGPLADDPLRTGELLVTSSESNFNPNCNNAGSVATWDLRGFDQGRTPKLLEVFRPVNGLPPSENPVANGPGCSAHWFDYEDGLLASAFYDHGTRFLDIDPETGRIAQVGWFQPRGGIATATFWGADGYAFTVDNARGIDVVRLDTEAPTPSADAFLASWLRPATAERAVATELQRWCVLGAG